MARIALFEDSFRAQKTLRDELKKTGPHHIETAERLSDALHHVAGMAIRAVEEQPDFVLVDGNLDLNDRYYGSYGPEGFSFWFPRAEAAEQRRRKLWERQHKVPPDILIKPEDEYSGDGRAIISFIRQLQQHPVHPTLLGAKIIGISGNPFGKLVDYDLGKSDLRRINEVMAELKPAQ